MVADNSTDALPRMHVASCTGPSPGAVCPATQVEWSDIAARCCSTAWLGAAAARHAKQRQGDALRSDRPAHKHAAG